MKRVRYINEVCNCIGHVISKIDGLNTIYSKVLTLICLINVLKPKRSFLDTLSNWMVYIDIDEINLNSRYTWAEDYLVMFLPSTLMETE